MIATGGLAFANARVRALKSRLLGRETLGRIQSANLAIGEQAFREFLEWHRMVSASYPSAPALWLALFRLHEIENVKLAWRAMARRHPFQSWRHLWIPMGRRAVVECDRLRDCTTLASLVEVLRGTAYASVADAMLRGHAADLAAAELGFDRWASRALVDAAGDLDAGESRTRALAIAIVRERDVNVLRRGTRAFGLSADAVVGALAFVVGEAGTEAIGRLAAWDPAQGPLWMLAPRLWQKLAGRAADWDALTLALRRWRRDECRRAFLDQPFSLAPALALLLLKQEEVRGVRGWLAVPDRTVSPALERTFAAGSLGA